MTERSFIPLRSRLQAQPHPAIRSQIGALVVQESASEFWNRQDSIQPSNFINKDCGGVDLISSLSGLRAQQPPTIRSRIGSAVVE